MFHIRGVEATCQPLNAGMRCGCRSLCCRPYVDKIVLAEALGDDPPPVARIAKEARPPRDPSLPSPAELRKLAARDKKVCVPADMTTATIRHTWLSPYPACNFFKQQRRIYRVCRWVLCVCSPIR